MNQRILDLWVQALKSGHYVQRQGQLRDASNRFCCLGVLCNLHAMEHPEIACLETNPSLYMGWYATLPTEVRDWAGLRSYQENWVMNMNDSGRDFAGIAHWLRKNG